MLCIHVSSQLDCALQLPRGSGWSQELHGAPCPFWGEAGHCSFCSCAEVTVGRACPFALRSALTALLLLSNSPGGCAASGEQGPL